MVQSLGIAKPFLFVARTLFKKSFIDFKLCWQCVTVIREVGVCKHVLVAIQVQIKLVLHKDWQKVVHDLLVIKKLFFIYYDLGEVRGRVV